MAVQTLWNPSASSIDSVFKYAYSAAVAQANQYLTPRLTPVVDNTTIDGEKTFFDIYDARDASTATGQGTDPTGWKSREANSPDFQTGWGEATDRNIATPTNWQISKSRRGIQLRRFGYVEYFDPTDQTRAMKALRADSDFIRVVLGMRNRLADEIVLQAFENDAFSGVTGAAATTFDTTYTVGTGSSAVAGSMTMTKLMSAIELLQTGDAPEGEDWYLVIHPAQYWELLNESANSQALLTSADFNSSRPLEDGVVGKFLGVNFVVCNKIPLFGATWFGATPQSWQSGNGTTGNTATATSRPAYLLTRSAVKFGTVGGVQTSMDIDFTRSGALQVAHYQQMAATRCFEDRIVRIECD